jgi:hypothetical protein
MENEIRGIGLNSAGFMELLCGACDIRLIIDMKCCEIRLIVGTICRTVIVWSGEEAVRDINKLTVILKQAFALGCVTLSIIPCSSSVCRNASMVQGAVSTIDPLLQSIKTQIYTSLLTQLNSLSNCSSDDPIPPPIDPSNPVTINPNIGSYRSSCC